VWGLTRSAAPAAAVVSADDQARIDALGNSYTGQRGGFKGTAPAAAGSVQAALDQVKAAQAPSKPLQRLGAFGGRKQTPISIESAHSALETALSKAEAQKAAKDAELAWIKSVGGMHHQGLLKHIGRQAEVHTAQVVVPVTAVVATALSIFLSPVVGTAAAAAGTGIARVAGAGEARNEGEHGRDARTAGRKLAKRTAIYGAYGVTAGAGVAALAGTAVLAGTTAGTVAGVVGTAAQTGVKIGTQIKQQQDGGGPTGGGPGISVNLGPAAAPAPAVEAKPLITKTDFELIALGAAGLLAYAAA
jgi:hypothetical protein